MLSINDVVALASQKGYIKHIETGETGVFEGIQKAKIDGVWVPGAAFRSRRDGALYWRRFSDFESFEELN